MEMYVQSAKNPLGCCVKESHKQKIITFCNYQLLGHEREFEVWCTFGLGQTFCYEFHQICVSDFNGFGNTVMEDPREETFGFHGLHSEATRQ